MQEERGMRTRKLWSAVGVVAVMSASGIAALPGAGEAAKGGQAPAGSAELAIGAPAPEFKLPGTDGKTHALADYGDKTKAVAVVFFCNHCPYAKAYEPVLLDLAKRYRDGGVAFVLISSNDANSVAEDSFEKMQERAKSHAYTVPYLYDESQAVARAYGARVTPHVFLLDSKHV